MRRGLVHGRAACSEGGVLRATREVSGRSTRSAGRPVLFRARRGAVRFSAVRAFRRSPLPDDFDQRSSGTESSFT